MNSLYELELMLFVVVIAAFVSVVVSWIWFRRNPTLLFWQVGILKGFRVYYIPENSMYELELRKIGFRTHTKILYKDYNSAVSAGKVLVKKMVGI